MLAEILAVGSVTEVRVPDAEEEALRDLSRLRSGTASDLDRARQHVNAILLRHGIRYPKDTPVDKGTHPVAAPPNLGEQALQFIFRPIWSKPIWSRPSCSPGTWDGSTNSSRPRPRPAATPR